MPYKESVNKKGEVRMYVNDKNLKMEKNLEAFKAYHYKKMDHALAIHINKYACICVFKGFNDGFQLAKPFKIKWR